MLQMYLLNDAFIKKAVPKNNNKKRTMDTKPKTKKKKRTKNFVNNGDLLAETIKSQEKKQMTDKLALMLMKMCEKYRYSSRGDFVSYTFLEDMRSYAMVNLVVAYTKFNAEKYTNAFAFYTSCIHNSFLQFLKTEKNQRNIRDKMLVLGGYNPSHTYVEEQKRKETEMRAATNDTHDNDVLEF